MLSPSFPSIINNIQTFPHHSHSSDPCSTALDVSQREPMIVASDVCQRAASSHRRAHRCCTPSHSRRTDVPADAETRMRRIVRSSLAMIASECPLDFDSIGDRLRMSNLTREVTHPHLVERSSVCGEHPRSVSLARTSSRDECSKHCVQ
jgi:hypothetical protein